MYTVGVVPSGTAFIGMVMFPKPAVPLCPVKVKDRVVVLED